MIVGGGTAGLTAALRLAENPDFSVAVVEAGSFYEFDDGNFSQIPAYAPDPQNIQQAVDWGIVTDPQPVR